MYSKQCKHSYTSIGKGWKQDDLSVVSLYGWARLESRLPPLNSFWNMYNEYARQRKEDVVVF